MNIINCCIIYIYIFVKRICGEKIWFNKEGNNKWQRKFLWFARDLEDIVQEVFIKAFKNLQSFDLDRSFSAWIYRIAHNEFINHGKKFSRDITDFFDLEVIFPTLKSNHNLEKDLQKEQDKLLLEQGLEKLPIKYREPLLLYYLEDLNYQEIADVLHIPTNTVGIRIMRGKAKLKDLIEQQK
jgi:RNA polymerase sigma-70 factor (ECF subfamily)